MNSTLDELVKLIEILDADINSISLEDVVKDYIVPIMKATIAEVAANRQLIQNTAHDTALAMITAQKTYAGEVITQVAELVSVLLDKLKLDPESEEGQALASIDELLGAWMAFDMADDDGSELDDEADDNEASVEAEVVEDDATEEQV
jgi:hypothetical protein